MNSLACASARMDKKLLIGTTAAVAAAVLLLLSRRRKERLPLTPEGKHLLLINLQVGGVAAHVHREIVELLQQRFGEQLVWDALKSGRTYSHLSLVYDFEIEPRRLPELEAALQAFVSRQQQPLQLHLSQQPRVWDGRVVSLAVDESSPQYATAEAMCAELQAELSKLKLIPEQLLAKPMNWHMTVAMRDANDTHGFDAEAIRECVAFILGSLTPRWRSFLFDNLTIMVKDGPPGPYRSITTAARTFAFPTERAQL